jgi:CBS-domain-containing membrane protein
MRNLLLTRPPSRRLVLGADTALELMTPSALFLPGTMTVEKAAQSLTARGLGASPVVDDAGRPVGVLSRADIVRYEGEAPGERRRTAGGRPGKRATTRVADIMSPVLLSLRHKTPAGAVVDALISLDVHQLFVTDDHGGIIGVVSARDVLRHLRLEPPGPTPGPG